MNTVGELTPQQQEMLYRIGGLILTSHDHCFVEQQTGASMTEDLTKFYAQDGPKPSIWPEPLVLQGLRDHDDLKAISKYLSSRELTVASPVYKVGTVCSFTKEGYQVYLQVLERRVLEHLHQQWLANPDTYTSIPSISVPEMITGWQSFDTAVRSLTSQNLIGENLDRELAHPHRRLYITHEGLQALGVEDRAASQNEVRKVQTMTLADLLAAGEGDFVEFKEYGCLDALRGQKSDHVLDKVVRAVASFLNTEGGVLLIGVSDAHVVVGVEREYSVANSKRPDWDGYSQMIIDAIANNLGRDCASLVKLVEEVEQGHTICRIVVQVSPVPRYLKGLLPVRATGSSHDLVGADMLRYIRSRWPSYNP